MTLRVALERLPDDRATKSAVRHVLGFLTAHKGEYVELSRVSNATGVDQHKVRQIMEAFQSAFVVDCGASGEPYAFRPSDTLSMEVQRFLRSANVPDKRLQLGIERFRNRQGGSGTV